MSSIINNNIINDDYVSTTVHTVDFGSFTAVTDIDLIKNRSILNRYQYTPSIAGQENTITFTFFSIQSIESCAVFGVTSDQLDNLRFELYNSVNTLIYATSSTGRTMKVRTENGEARYDRCWQFDSVAGVKYLRLKYDSNSAGSGYIGLVFAGSVIDLNIKPTSLTYQFMSQGQKQRTLGGQIVADRSNSYMKATFTTTASIETDVINNYFDLNYQSSTSEPIIFIPQTGENIILYGTQERLNSSRMVMGKKDGEWLYETSFSIEEEF